jgi:hypothetical protein
VVDFRRFGVEGAKASRRGNNNYMILIVSTHFQSGDQVRISTTPIPRGIRQGQRTNSKNNGVSSERGTQRAKDNLVRRGSVQGRTLMRYI